MRPGRAQHWVSKFLATFYFPIVKAASIALVLNTFTESARAEPTNGNIGRRLRTAVDLFREDMWTYNPAAVPTGKDRLELMRTHGQVHSQANIPRDGSDEARFFLDRQTETALGVNYGLGMGASMGLLLGYFDYQHSSESSLRDQAAEDQQTWIHAAARFSVDLGSDLRLAFDYQHQQNHADIQGSLDVSPNDRTEFVSSRAGYRVGVVYHQNNLRIGGHYAPAMRGKAEIVSEHKLFASPGLWGAEAAYKMQNRWVIGLSLDRWQHRKDEAHVRASSPEDQRRMSLRGMSLEQFLFPMEQRSVALMVPLDRQWMLLAGYSNELTFFAPDEFDVPEIDDQRRDPLTLYRYTLALRIHQEASFGEIRYQQRRFEADELRDNMWWFGAGTYREVSLEDHSLTLACGVFL